MKELTDGGWGPPCSLSVVANSINCTNWDPKPELSHSKLFCYTTLAYLSNECVWLSETWSAGQEFPRFYRARSFYTVHTRVQQWILSCDSWVLPIHLYLISWTSVLIFLSSHLHVNSPKWCQPLWFSNQYFLHRVHFCQAYYIFRAAHRRWFRNFSGIRRRAQLWNV